ncbi:MAG TPA: hypothetical protein DCE43_10710 [Planctomycetaceae bacterium]|nr:hypothetical protein [Planctomycetaceae bacterium]|tara:strand:- start:196 stop:2478 length:2283 start_codon:yes stop_codon:yes gene_type:complete
MMKRLICWMVGLVLLTGQGLEAASPLKIRLDVRAGKHDRTQTPLVASVPLPAAKIAASEVVLTDANGKRLPAQLTASSLLKSKNARAELHWVLPALKANTSTHFTATIQSRTGKTQSPRSGFSWKNSPGRYTDVLHGDRPIVRYMYKAYENDPAKRDLDNKPFHHVFDPAGTRLLTKGTGGLYTHHQGLFYGFTRCTFPGGKCNTWYCHEGEHELHRKVLAEEAGPVVARHRTEIDWNDLEGKPFCRENRELAVFAVGGGTLIEWSSRLWSVRGTVTLDGDAQHAGFQFRAADEVAQRQKQKLVYYLRPDGKGELGATRNPIKGKGAEDPVNKPMVNMPWNAMSFVLGPQRYTAVYLDSPRNPKPSFASERAYGRFGGWFGKQTLVEGKRPIELIYRVWVQRGEMAAGNVNRLAADFASPPTVAVSVVGENGNRPVQKKPANKKKRARKNSPFQQVTDDPTLPRVLLIGDSISIGYTLPLRAALKGQANVHRPATNCGPTTRGIQELDKWLESGDWDVIHFNWGLHDLKYLGADGKSLADPKSPGSRQQVPIEKYEKNLRQLVARLKKTGATLIWRNTTPVPPGAKGRVVGDSVKYNAVAARVMKDNGISTDDMYTFAKARLKEIQRPANVHFFGDGSKALAGHAAAIIRKSVNPRTGLRTMIQELTRLLEEKEFAAALKLSVRPEDLKRILEKQTFEKLVEGFSMKKAGQLLAVLRSIKDATPGLGMDARIASFPLATSSSGKKSIVFEKIGRFWYVRN